MYVLKVYDYIVHFLHLYPIYNGAFLFVNVVLSSGKRNEDMTFRHIRHIKAVVLYHRNIRNSDLMYKSTEINALHFLSMNYLYAGLQYKSVRVGLVTFHTNSTIVFHLDDFTETEDIRQAILEVPFVGGMTYTDDALDMARRRLFRVGIFLNVFSLTCYFRQHSF